MQQQQQQLPTPAESQSTSQQSVGPSSPAAQEDDPSSSGSSTMIILPSPTELSTSIPLTSEGQALVKESRETVSNILNGSDNRVMAVVGPCSIHDVDAAVEYAKGLKSLQEKFKDRIFVVMRTYCEKPRTQEGWKGLVRDPDLDNTEDIAKGITVSRRLIVKIINEVGLPCGAELLDPLVCSYFADILSWGAIGARTSESQVHRDLTCSLSEIPIGFKNSTSGDILGAIDSIKAARCPRSLLTIDPASGRVAMKHCRGSVVPHLVLRGGRNGPNFYKSDVVNAASALQGAAVPNASQNNSRVSSPLAESCQKHPLNPKEMLRRIEQQQQQDEADASGGPLSTSSSSSTGMNYGPRILIDCSHGNSMKDFRRQQAVARDVSTRIELNELQDGHRIAGIMLESFLVAGKQEFDPCAYRKRKVISSVNGGNTSTEFGDISSSKAPTITSDDAEEVFTPPLEYGQSVTDSCIDLATTSAILQDLFEKTSVRFSC